MEFNSYKEASDYINGIDMSSILSVGMIIRETPWTCANQAESDYYIITKITNCFVMVEELGMSKKYEGAEYGGYRSIVFRLYKMRNNKDKKKKFSIKKLSAFNLIADKTNKKYGFWSLNETYGGEEDWGR